MSSESIWVGMRLRPLVERERGQAHCLKIEGTEVVVVEAALDAKQSVDVHKSVFAFDVAMDSTDPLSSDYVSQEKCYEIMGQRMVEHMMQGFNTCLFCYGQTGTGKTTTIMGNAKPARERGLLLRLVDDVFAEVDSQSAEGCQVHVVLQMLEVYNEKLNDLLVEDASGNAVKNKIKIHVHPEFGVYLTNATEAPVKTAEECIKTIGYGNTMKVVHATAMNAQSSRGHTICKLSMYKEGGKDNVTSNSEVYFADLAGRENEKETKVRGERFVELGFINKSLHHLANCIRELGTPKRRKTVCAENLRVKAQPNDMSKFRNSKLTLLLSNALSGNSRTSMIGTLSPAASNFEESHNTLKFASTVKTIKVEAKAAKALDKDALVKQLKGEIQELRKQLEQAREKQDDEALKELTDHLEASSAIVAAQTRDWVHFQEENQLLSTKRSKSFMVSSNDVGETPLPYLANYSEDPHLAFKLVMHVPLDGQERSLGADVGCDFRLPPGLGVLSTIGYIRNSQGRLVLRCAPGRPSAIEVNGTKLINEQELEHLDRILFGKYTTFFIFLQRASLEELTERLASGTETEDWDGRVQVILGEERSQDPVEAQLARDYCSQLQSQNRDSEGLLKLGAFMRQASRANRKVDEANELTKEVRPSSGLHFELAAQAPVLSYGFPTAHLPELCVRLVRRASPLERFRLAVRKVMALHGKQRVKVAFQSVLSEGPSGDEIKEELLTTWTWSKFLSRLDMMYEVRQAWLADPALQLDKWKDPWAECGLADVEGLQEEHQRHVEDLRQRMRQREAELQRLQEELLAAQAELRRKGREVPEAYRLPAGEEGLARCLELGKANKALLESLCGEQRNSLDL